MASPGHGLVGFTTLALPVSMAMVWLDLPPGQACLPTHALVGFTTLTWPGHDSVGFANLVVWLVSPPWPGLLAWPGVIRPANLVCGL